MILYINDYKQIYIITMMGKINNIPVLNEDVIRLVVLNEEIIGYIYPRRTSYVVALEIKPGRTTLLISVHADFFHPPLHRNDCSHSRFIRSHPLCG